MSSELQYIEFFQQNRQAIDGRSCEVLNTLRDEAFRTFSSQGFPMKKQERYRYTDVGMAFSPDYGIALTPLKVEGLPYCYRLSEAPVDVASYYNKVADQSDSLVALNNMLAVDALVIFVPRNTRPDHPIQVSNMLQGEHDVMMTRRILIVLEEGAQADVIITDRASDKRQFMTNQVIEVVAKDNSNLSLYEIEETHLLCHRFSNVFIRQGRYSNVRHTSLTLFNGLTRNRVDVQLQGEHSEVTLNGCVIIDKMQRVDNNTLIDHQVSNCQSNQLYKYVLDDQSVGAFAGRILVREGAQKTTSQETNANLLATKTARMYTQPMLEIYADDVKCAHGSTVGQLNEQALFYMRQRGISEAEARMLLKSAFITEVIDTIPLESLRDRLHFLVDSRLRGELSKCEGCKMCK